MSERGKKKNKLRALITERSYVATRGGVEALMPQLYYEARVRGMAQAQRILVIADGAVWIWNLVGNHFEDAVQRLDLFHANAYLWAVANELHGKGSAEARHSVKPLLRQIRNDKVAEVITQLEGAKTRPGRGRGRKKLSGDAIEYYKNNQARMKYKDARRRNEPSGWTISG